MKILAIRGENLASLQGEFELDFTAPPLAGCGLFSISGETGAGKSTILDAMCLALYGRYPRISGEGRKDRVENTAGDNLLNSDPRSILRTGSSRAFAQVDLMIGDKKLQASWQVRRARGRARGNLLAFERSLVDLNMGKVLAAGKKNVDREITRRLQLTYDQFGRTVLLAQNDFDAFLRANDRERADLLEKITGTDLYSKISVRAWETERHTLQELQNLQRETGFISVLGQAERDDLCKAIGESEKNNRQLQDKIDKIRAALDWHKRRDQARQRLEQATRRHKKARQELRRDAVDKNWLEKRALASRLRPLVEAAQHQEKIHLGQMEEKTHYQSELKGLKQDIKQAQKARKKSSQHLETIEKQLARAAPLFERCIELDTRKNALHKSCKEMRALLQQASRQLTKLQKQRDKLRREKSELDDSLDECEKKIQQENALERLSGRRDELALLFSRLDELVPQRQELASEAEKKQHQLQQLQKRLRASKADGRKIDARMAKLADKLDAKTQQLAGLAPETVRLQRDRQIEFQNALGLLHHHLTAVVEQTATIARIEKSCQQAGRKIAAATGRLQQAEAELRDNDSRQAEVDELLEHTRTALSKQVVRLRAQLVAGRPCPVCGSCQHPGHDDEELEKLLGEMRSRTVELQQKGQQTRKRRDRFVQEIQNGKAQELAASERLAIMRCKLADLNKRSPALLEEAARTAGLLDVDLKCKGPADERLKIVARQMETLEQRIIDVRKRLTIIQQTETEKRELENRLAVLERQRRQHVKDRDELAARENSAREQQALRRLDQQRLDDRMENLMEQLSGLLQGFDAGRDDLERDHSSLHKLLQRRIAQYEKLKHEREARRKKAVSLREKLSLVEQQIKQQGEHLAEKKEELALMENDLQGLVEQRRQLFDGEPVKQVRSRLTACHDKAVAKHQNTTRRHQELSARQKEMEKHLQRLTRQMEKTKLQRTRATDERDRALADQKLQLQEVADLLAVDDDKVLAMKRRLERLQTEQTRWEAMRRDRKHHLEELEQQAVSSRSREELALELEEMEADQAMLMIDLGKNKSRLENDDAARKQQARLTGRLEKLQKTHALWEVMSAAIGSSDGARFRRFAQGITLDHLIALANRQLDSINRRYRLERSTFGGLGLQIVDREMGGEVRSVHSLSGGERFLVSLALALGLSQLDGRTSFVDILMIDEGFGALDVRSLDIVMEALESLQSQGRRVGVISHIEALAERIPVQVLVEKQGNGRSRVRVVDSGEQAYANRPGH